MHTLSAAWRRALLSAYARKVLLVTVSPDGLDPTSDVRHLAAEPNVIRAASDMNVHVSGGPGGAVVPFWPTLIDWPALTQRLVIRQRRMEIAETTLSIARGADLASRLVDTGGGYRATVRVDLWSDGIGLADVIPVFAGRVRDVPRANDRSGPVTLIAADGEPDTRVSIGATPLTGLEFPDAPAAALAGATHQHVLGAFQQPVDCVQIDAEGHWFYAFAHPLASPPTAVARNGERIADGWQVVERETPYGRVITALHFDEPVQTLAGGLVTDSITCSDGIGITGRNVLRILLESLANVRLTARARESFDAAPFELSALANAEADVLDLALRRLIPQTALAAGFRHGRIDAVPLLPATSRCVLHVGAGLRYRVDEATPETPLDAIANHIVVRCGQSTDGAEQVTVRRTPATTGGRLRARLERSVARYGMRTLSVDAPDLRIDTDGVGGYRCPSGEVLADQLAYCHSLPAAPRMYAAEWLEGMALEPGDSVSLTDTDQGLADASMRVSGWTLTPAGPRLMIEDDPWA